MENLPEIFENRAGTRLESPRALGASLQHTSPTILNTTTAKRRNQAKAERNNFSTQQPNNATTATETMTIISTANATLFAMIL